MPKPPSSGHPGRHFSLATAFREVEDIVGAGGTLVRFIHASVGAFDDGF